MKKNVIMIPCLCAALCLPVLGCSSAGPSDEAEAPVTPPPVTEVPVPEAPSADTSLAILTICGSSSLAGSFDGEGRLEYGVEYSEDEAIIQASATVAAAVVSIDKGSTFPLAVGRNEAIITVTAADGVTVKRYTIVITRAKSPDASLSALTVSAGTLVPAFIPGQYAYTVAALAGDRTITVTASAAMTGAVVSITPAQPVTLPVGATTITVSVTAPNGTARKDYSVTVTRAAPYPAEAVSHDGHHYLVVNPAMAWSDGKAACEGRLGHLATISNAAENAIVMNLLVANGTNGFIGLSDRVSESVFVWVTGEPVGYANWLSGEPNNAGNEDVVSMDRSNGKWNDFSDSLSLPVVCEWDE